MYSTTPLVLVDYRPTSSKNQHKKYYNKLKKAFKDIEDKLPGNGESLKLTRKNPLAVELILAIDDFMKHGVLSSDITYYKFLCEYLARGEMLDLKFTFGKNDHQSLCFGWLKQGLSTNFLHIQLHSMFSGDKALNVKFYSDKAAFFNKDIQDLLIHKLIALEGRVNFLLLSQYDDIYGEIYEHRPAIDIDGNFVIPGNPGYSASTSSGDSIIECNYLIKDTEVERSSSLNNFLTIENEIAKAREYKLKKMQEDVTNGDLTDILKDIELDEIFPDDEGNGENPIEVHLEVMQSINKQNDPDIPNNCSPVEILTNDEQLERERMRLIERETKQMSTRTRTISRALEDFKSESVPSSSFTENCISKMKNRKNSTDDKREKVLEKCENVFKTVKLTRNRTNPESFIINSIRNFGTAEMLGKSPTTSLSEVFHEPNNRMSNVNTTLFDLPNESDASVDDDNMTSAIESNNAKSNFGEIPQDPGDIMHLLAEVFQEPKEKFDSMFGVFIGHTIGEPKFQYLCISTINVYLLSKVTEGIADACEAFSEEVRSIDSDVQIRSPETGSFNSTKDIERKHESASYIIHLIIPLNDIDMISVSYDYQSLICSSRNGCFVKDNHVMKKNNYSFCIDIGSELVGQNIFKKIKLACEKYSNETGSDCFKMPIISIDQNIKRFLHLKFLKNELKEEELTIHNYSLIYWKHDNAPSFSDHGNSNIRVKLLYREEDTSSWKIVSSNVYKPWEEAYSELTYNQIIGFRDREGKDAIFSIVICEHVKSIVEENNDDTELYIFTVIPKENSNKLKFQLGFKNYNEMCKWMNCMKEFLEDSEFKEFNRPLSTQLFITDKHMIVSSEHTNFDEKGNMRINFTKEIKNDTKIMYHSTDNRHVLILFNNSDGYHCLLFRDEYELEKIVSSITNIFNIRVPHLIELKESDKAIYFRLVQSFDEWTNVWMEHFTNNSVLTN
uniref:RUN domain-containing protein n=1 Tax=Parastrongyloides trichosuri TaxID=131310 RepID=A0A0N4ZAV4_PARTI